MKLCYDEEKFQVHMTNHFTCHLCPESYKFMHYDNYVNLENHFRLSHHLCEDAYCKTKCFVAFRLASELEIHTTQVHKAVFQEMNSNRKQQELLRYEEPTRSFIIIRSSQQLTCITGFNYGKTQGAQLGKKAQTHSDEFVLNDKEGIDFEGDFLSQRKTKVKTLLTTQHSDEVIDLRELYRQKLRQSQELPNHEMLL